MNGCRCPTIDPEDREHVYLVKLGIFIYLDPDNLPLMHTEEGKVIAAEHVIDFIHNTLRCDPEEVATYVDNVELEECRSMRPTKEVG